MAQAAEAHDAQLQALILELHLIDEFEVGAGGAHVAQAAEAHDAQLHAQTPKL